MSDEQDKLNAVMRIHDLQIQGDDDKVVTLVNGVKLEIGGISPFILMSLDSQLEFRHPPVPTVYDEEKSRNLPNPMDPDYLEECNRRDQLKGEALLDAIIGLGTRVVFIPEDVEPPDSPGWSTKLVMILKIEVPPEGPGRTMLWIKYIAITSGEDATRITMAARKQLGITEEEVQDAIVGFRSDEE